MLFIRFSLFACVVFIASQIQAAQNLFVLESYGSINQVHEITPAGVDLGVFADVSAAGLRAPIYMAFDSKNNLYVEDYAFPGANQVHKFGPNGADLGVFVSAGLNGSQGIAFDFRGNLYVANNNDGKILRFNPNGILLDTFATVPGALGIAFDPSGNLLVAKSTGVTKISPLGVTLGNVGPFALCNNVAADKDGNIYASVAANHEVHKYSPSLADLGIFASVSQAGALNFDSDGNLFVADLSSYSVQKFSPTGQILATFPTANLLYPSSIAFKSVPEPSTLALLTFGGVIAFAAKRRTENVRRLTSDTDS